MIYQVKFLPINRPKLRRVMTTIDSFLDQPHKITLLFLLSYNHKNMPHKPYIKYLTNVKEAQEVLSKHIFVVHKRLIVTVKLILYKL